MKAPALSKDEEQRLLALGSCDVLDTAPEEDFDSLVKLAAQLTESPIATVSMVDRRRQWFKAKVGMDAEETPREISFCGHTILGTELMEVPDALEDLRFADNPMVLGGPEVRFYAGAPLITSDGFALGTLCVKDTRPRELTKQQRDALTALARQAVAQLELRRKIGELERETSSRKKAEDQATQGRERYWRIFHSMPAAILGVSAEGVVTELNPSAEDLFGYREQEAVGAPVAELIIPERFRESFEAGLELATNGRAREILDRPMKLVGKRANGVELQVEATVTLGGRDPISFVVFARDLGTTHRARAREQPQEEVAAASDGGEGATAEREDWTRRILEAVDNGDFFLDAQPILAMEDDSVHAYELLVRMRGPGGERIMPGEFLGKAEEYEVIADLDRWVVGEGIRLAASRRVAINLSGTSMGDAVLLELIQGRAEECGVDPRNVIFEVTETAAIDNLDQAGRFVHGLVEMGFGFALDDFGTGFGSLTYLKHIPVSYLKIDMQFVRGLLTSDEDRRIVESIVAVAEKFGMRTIAEGVEDGATLERLREGGVDFAQGYGLQRPGPLEDTLEARPSR